MKLDGISAEAERLFVRLIMKADDFGRFHAEPRLVKAGCFPLEDAIRLNDLIRWLDELSTRQLILRYELQGRKFLALINWGQRLRDTKAKFPPPAGERGDWVPDGDIPPQLAATCGNPPQPAATCGESRPETETETDTESEACGSARAPERQAVQPLLGSPKPLPGVPPTEAEVIAHGALVGMGPEDCRKFWLHYESVCWTVKGTTVANWRARLLSWKADNEQRRHVERNGTSGPFTGKQEVSASMQAMVQMRELDEIEKRLKSIRDSYDGHQDWSNEDKVQARKLKDRRQILKKILGIET